MNEERKVSEKTRLKHEARHLRNQIKKHKGILAQRKLVSGLQEKLAALVIEVSQVPVKD